jgi:LacI family transcriptional regulator
VHGVDLVGVRGARPSSAQALEREDLVHHERHRATRRVLDTDPGITGLICMNDRLTFGAYQAIQERGLRVPADISIASFDDDELARYLRPQLTTARLPYEEMGREAMEMLLSPDGPGSQHRVVTMPLQVRGSIGPPRA